MKEVTVLGNENFVLGFQLAGVGKAFILDEDRPETIFKELMSDSDVGLVILQQETFDMLSPEMRESVSGSIDPVFMMITEDETNEEMRRLIKKSIGVDLWDK